MILKEKVRKRRKDLRGEEKEGSYERMRTLQPFFHTVWTKRQKYVRKKKNKKREEKKGRERRKVWKNENA